MRIDNILYFGNDLDDNQKMIDSIYQFIKEELTCGDASDEFLKSFVIPQTEMYIHQLKYSTKLSKFGLEKEIRLLKHIPKVENYNEDYQIVETNGKHYIYTEFPHYCCWDVRLVGNYKTDEAQRYRDWLSDSHYRVI